MISNANIKVDKSKFVLTKNKVIDTEKISGESISFWHDAFRQLKKNKLAIVALIFIVIIGIFSIIGPNINKYNYENRVIKNKSLAIKIPPRIPYIEKLGIFDGTMNLDYEINSFNSLSEGKKQYYEVIKTYDKNGVTYIKAKVHVYKLKGIEDKYFWFGTDDLGRDLWTRLWYGTRISLYIGLLAAFVDLTIGVTYGSIAGYYGGSKVDNIMMRITEVIGGIPSLVVLLIFLLILKPGLLSLSLAISATGWIGAARIVRSQFLKLKDQEFVLAARTLGASPFRLIFKHMYPNVIGQLVVMVTFTVPAAIFYEAFLAFIGLGMPMPIPSIGTLINDGYSYMKSCPYMLWIPTFTICLLMLSINIFANGLRDSLDPKMRVR
ncbi:ABC transporter permease [Clostridiaceae bacterium M8S5]|nr:ABC transporter permease [Clostridiaceae bacterium M8S5]